MVETAHKGDTFFGDGLILEPQKFSQPEASSAFNLLQILVLFVIFEGQGWSSFVVKAVKWLKWSFLTFFYHAFLLWMSQYWFVSPGEHVH